MESVWRFLVCVMLNKLKIYALAALGIISAVFAALFYREKAKHQEAIKDGIQEAREIEHEAQDQLNEDLEKERLSRENATNRTDRTDFE